MREIAATTARFIKLGSKGSWEEQCIESSPGTIRLGFNKPLHQECLDGHWGAIYDYWLNERKRSQGKATEIRNQIKDFYTLDADALWITFYRRRLYWCFALCGVHELDYLVHRINGRVLPIVQHARDRLTALEEAIAEQSAAARQHLTRRESNPSL